MQIASLIKGAEGHSLKWTGPDVLFFDDGSIKVCGHGHLTKEEFQHVWDMHVLVNTRTWKNRLLESQQQSPGVVHNPRPGHGASHAPHEPYFGTTQ